MRNLPPHVDPKAKFGTVHDTGVRRRWSLQRKAQSLLCHKHEKENRHGDRVPAFTYRVAMCHRGTDGGAPVVMRSPDGMNARFAGLQTCGSVWHCPVCAPKVAAVRRDEMNAAIKAWKNRGGDVYFLTYTMQHDAETYGAGELDAAGAALGAALSRFKASRQYCALREQLAAQGTIRCLEVTYGEINGWHVHTHELMFAKPGQLQVLRQLRGAWARLLLKRGLGGRRRRPAVRAAAASTPALLHGATGRLCRGLRCEVRTRAGKRGARIVGYRFGNDAGAHESRPRRC
jgi:hypothetical protein